MEGNRNARMTVQGMKKSAQGGWIVTIWSVLTTTALFPKTLAETSW